MIYASRNKMYAIMSYLCISFYSVFILIDECTNNKFNYHLIIFILIPALFLVNAYKGVKATLQDSKSYVMLLVSIIVIIVALIFLNPSLDDANTIIPLMLIGIALGEVNYRFNHKFDLFK